MPHAFPPKHNRTTDSTELAAIRHASDELRASEARYRSLVQASSAILWLASAAGHLEGEQASWTSFTGQSTEQFDGWGWLDAIHPDDREYTAAAWHAALATSSMYQIEHRLRRADGQHRYMNARAVPIFDGAGAITEWVGIHIDIDERKRVEERLRLLDAMSQATRNADDPKTIMEVTTRMLGEHLGATRCPYADVESDNDRFTIRHDWTAPGAASTVGVYSLDLFGARAASDMREGRTLRICDVDRELDEAGGAAMFNAIACRAIICCPLVKEGKLVAMMAVHQDRPRQWTAPEVALVEQAVERSWAHIERVRATEALREADRRKTEFLAILAHELRNPLAPIRNGLQVMRMAEHDQATVARVRDMMERQVTQMVTLVNDLLDIARITRGNLELKPVRVELRELVASAVETSMPLIDANRHTLSLDIAPGSLPLDADPTRIAQVIGNVLNNAAKYTAAGGRIEVLAWRDGVHALLSIRDTGIGIPPESALAVFEMFSQVGASLDRAQGGLGIGLSLARRLVELHHGTIELVRDATIKGSRFDIRLPLAPDVAAQAPGADTSSGSVANGLRVLVVDDNLDAADMLSELMEIIGHTSRVANDGARALALAEQFKPDVAFLDIGMPGMNGYEVARALRGMTHLAPLVLVALTGWGDDKDRARSKEAGFDHHLIKPANLEAVERLLTDLVEKRQA
ncbi:PAS domain-containing hybrid sensor histidine kinase/response regulator [Massilia genomosp. 1]|uniref:histidine kinase n=1 Tax=Massilia genomosp. 1 TaxID=2609280 RepID=A0ABX0MP52_9BURK|nr:ATP-binding protein [Massilia genomosp. 1]NHZ64559.1 PAS domain-containing protein [Massilia genomosp. 1]